MINLIQQIIDECNVYYSIRGYPPKELILYGDTYHEFMSEVSKHETFSPINIKDINSNKFLGMVVTKKPNPTWRLE